MLLFDISEWPTIQTAMRGLAENLPALERLVEAVCYMTGFLLAFRGIYKLKEYGELRMMMSSQTDLRRPLGLFIIAAILIYIPQMYHIGIQTVFGTANPSPLAYETTDYGTWHGLVSVVVKIIRFIGLVAFVRGWIMMSGLTGHSSPPGTFGKSLMHIFGGVLAMNVVGTMHVMESTFGVQWGV